MRNDPLQIQPEPAGDRQMPTKLRKVLLIGVSLFAAVALGGLVIRFAHPGETKDLDPATGGSRGSADHPARG